MPDLLNDFPFKQETYNIIGACMEVHRNLGRGFLEAIYQEALEIEFSERGIPYNREKLIDVFYKDRMLSKKYIADFICYDEIIIELKALEEINNEHISQLINYLSATNKKIGLIVNFGANSLQYKRIVK